MPEEKKKDETEKKPLTFEEMQKEFIQFLDEKGYDMNGLSGLENEEDIKTKPFKRKKIKKISEDLNGVSWNFPVYADTTKLLPGFVVYVIEKIDSKPYDKFKPVAKVITEIHDNGVNHGQFFLTYNHEFIKNPDFKGYKPKGKTKEKEYIVVSKEEEFFSPLTKEQATYMCDLLNFQAKQAYVQGINKILKTKKTKGTLEKKNKINTNTVAKVSQENQK